MKNRLFRWAVRLVAVVLLALVTGVTLIVGTDTGTRWLLQIASPYLPRQLVLSQPEGSLLRGFSVAELHWRSDTADIRVNALAFDIELRPLFRRDVVIRSLVAGSVDVVLTPAEPAPTGQPPFAVDLPVGLAVEEARIRNIAIRRGDLDRRIDFVELAAELDGHRLDIQRLQIGSRWLTLGLRGSARLAPGYRANLAADWRIQGEAGRTFAGRLLLDGTAAGYDIENSLAEPLALTTTGRVRLDGTAPLFDVENRWSNLEWPAGTRVLRSAEGVLALRGDLAEFVVDLDADAGLDGLPVTSIRIVGDATRDSLRFSELVASNEYGRLQANGEASWLPGRSADFDFVLSGVDPSRISPRLAGELDAEGSARLVIDATNQATVLANVARLGGRLNDQPLAGSGQIGYGNTMLSLAGVEVRIGDSSLRASGSIGDNLALEGTVEIPGLGVIDPGFAGAVAGDYALNGPRNRPAIRLALRGTDLLRESTLIGSGDAALDGYLDEHRLRIGLDRGQHRLDVEARGGLAEGGWAGEVTRLDIGAGPLGDWSTATAAGLRLGSGQFELGRLCLDRVADGSSLCAELDYGPDTGAAFSAALAGMPVTALPYRLPPGVTASGTVNAEASGLVTGGRLTGVGEIRLVGAGLDADYEGEAIAIDFATAAANVRIEDNALEATLQLDIDGGGGDAAVSFSVADIGDPASPISGTSDLAFTDTALVAMFAPGISDPQGRLHGSLAVSGTRLAPEFSGEVALVEASFGVAAAGIRIHDAEARLQQLAAGQLRLTGSARSGDGRVDILGTTTLVGDTGMRTELSIRGSDFELMRVPDLRFSASPDISVVLDQDAAKVSGRLLIPHAMVEVKSLPTAAVKASPDAVVHREAVAAPEAYRRVDINVTTELGRDVRLAGFGLTTALEGSVRIEGGTHTPYSGYGRLSTRGGRYKAYGQDLRIDRGELIFNGALDNPILDVRAVREAGDVLAGIQLSGTPQQLRSDVFSEPSLSDAEALSYLLTGRPLAAAADSGDGDLLNKAAFALGLSQAGNVAAEVRTRLGLETLAIEGGTEDSRVVAGKRFGDRLLVEYGYGIIDKLGTLLLRYQLTERLMLESRTGAVSNVDVVYTVRKK